MENIRTGMMHLDNRQMHGVYTIEESDPPPWFYPLVGISLFFLKIVLTLAACVAIVLSGAHGHVAGLLGFIASMIIWSAL